MALNASVLAMHLFYPLYMCTIRVFSGEVGLIFYLFLRTHQWKLFEEKLRIKAIEPEVIQAPTTKHTPFCYIIFQSEKEKSLFSMKTVFFFFGCTEEHFAVVPRSFKPFSTKHVACGLFLALW